MGIREERRREMMGKIFADADRQLVAGGPAALSLREWRVRWGFPLQRCIATSRAATTC